MGRETASRCPSLRLCRCMSHRLALRTPSSLFRNKHLRGAMAMASSNGTYGGPWHSFRCVGAPLPISGLPLPPLGEPDRYPSPLLSCAAPRRQCFVNHFESKGFVLVVRMCGQWVGSVSWRGEPWRCQFAEILVRPIVCAVAGFGGSEKGEEHSKPNARTGVVLPERHFVFGGGERGPL